MRRYDSMLIEAAGIDSGGRLDPAAIAQGVRQIAHDLHAMLKNAASSPVELMELSGASTHFACTLTAPR